MSQAPTVVIPVPFRSHLTHPLEAGQTISIHGHVKEDAKEFQLNLLSGSSSIDPQSVVALHCQSILISGIPTGDRFEINLIDRQGNIVFHLNPRLNEKKVVRSAFINGEWGPEEREGPQPFKKDTAFDIVIQNQPYSLQVFVNGQRFTAFAHRTADPQTISYYAMKIDGNVEITGLEVSYPQDNNVYEY
ncbi:Galectin [Aphelenchoides besseyi]|nr:Galectin [Aphelenchoides besseyi]